MAVLRFNLLLLLSILFSPVTSSYSQTPSDQHGNLNAQAGPDCSSSNPIVCEIQELKLQVVRLESLLENATERMDSKSHNIEKFEKRIEEMNHEIGSLQSDLSSLKHVAAEEDRINELKKEVTQLWRFSRKNNFELHTLQSKAEEAENQFDALTLQAEQMADIVTELWIQIQQMEQALKIAEIRKAELQKQLLYSRCTFFKLFKRLSESQYLKLPGFLHRSTSSEKSYLVSLISKSFVCIKGLLSGFKKYHHQLQGIVRQEMQRHSVTTPLANAELVFVVASAMILFPIVAAWTILSSRLSI